VKFDKTGRNSLYILTKAAGWPNFPNIFTITQGKAKVNCKIVIYHKIGAIIKIKVLNLYKIPS